ncbi:MbtH family protein [Labrenzia sp. THAF82]|uniref:MbtH family protein n=1 Tax=Labrenzia sp. THAF82 TaxID=2587861 RepID=UPI001268997B|nr:MbtH family protein [Labrenzia sp. THAF82]
MVLVNDEEQYSLWPSAQPIPEGWRQVGPIGAKQECLKWINRNWPDIAPLSIRSSQT